MIKTDKLKFNSHVEHNPCCDIVEYKIDSDTFITYGVYLLPTVHGNKSIQPGDEFMEMYVGENYNRESQKRSYSRMYYASEIPAKWQSSWNMLKDYYNKNLKNIYR